MYRIRVLFIVSVLSILASCSIASQHEGNSADMFSNHDDITSQGSSQDALFDTFGAVYTLFEGEPKIFSNIEYSYVPVPDKEVSLYYAGFANTWKEIAEETGYSESELRSINPHVLEQADGSLIADPNYSSDGALDILLELNYHLPDTACQKVYVELPEVTDEDDNGNVYILPAALDEHAAIVFAEALEFLFHTQYNMTYRPCEESSDGAYYTLPGARFATMTDFQNYLYSILTPEFANYYLDEQTVAGYTYRRFFAGDNDALCMERYAGTMGRRNLVGATYTEPKVQPDGKIVFGMLALFVKGKYEEFSKNIIDSAEALDSAYYMPICLVADGSGGWRVDSFEYVDMVRY